MTINHSKNIRNPKNIAGGLPARLGSQIVCVVDGTADRDAWDYPQFTVYFESDRVIRSVLKTRAKPLESAEETEQ